MKLFNYSVLFFLIGELIFQLNYFMNNVEISDTVNEPNRQFDSSLNKIFLLGDSYTKGLGIKNEMKLSSLIKLNKYQLIDSSSSGDNWADYASILNCVKNDIDSGSIIIIGVNWNDIAFNSGAIKKILNPSVGPIQIENQGIDVRSNTKPNTFVSIVRFVYAKSRLISFLSANIQNLFKRKGMPLPIGDFNYYRTKAYQDKDIELKMVMGLIDEISTKKDIHFILYLMPDFNLTKNVEYFKTFVSFFANFRNYKKIHLINGIEEFRNEKDGYYCISIHDGHPNGLAHKKIADRINNELILIAGN